MRTIALVLASATLLSADEVVLRSGGRVSGAVEERGDSILIRTEHGHVSVPRDQVLRIDRTKSSSIQDFEERLRSADLGRASDVEGLIAFADVRKMPEQAKDLRARLATLKWEAVDRSNAAKSEEFALWAQANGQDAHARFAFAAALALRKAQLGPVDADGRYQLGLWARERGLGLDALLLFQETIVHQPDHEFARRALGYHLHQARWMTAVEVKLALGLIEFEGDWMTPRSKEAILEARTLAKERKAIEEERRKLDAERALAAAEYAGRAAERAALERRAADLARRIHELEQTRILAVPVPVVIPPACTRPGCVLRNSHTHQP